MESLTAFNVFVHVADTRSFASAARSLGVSPSAVGKSIARLEERLGVRLVNRSTRSVALTSEGEIFLGRCRRILAEIEAAEDEISRGSVVPRGKLRISLPLVSDPFLPVLAEFRCAYPDIDLDLDFTDRRVDVIEEEFDAVLRCGEIGDTRLTARVLGGYRMHLVGAPGYFAEHGVPHRFADLSGHVCIRFRFPHTGRLEVWPRPAGPAEGTYAPLPMSVVCNSLPARLNFALVGAGIAYLPDFAVRDMLADGRLVSVLDECGETGTFRIVWPSGRHPPPKLRAFIDFLKEHLQMG